MRSSRFVLFLLLGVLLSPLGLANDPESEQNALRLDEDSLVILQLRLEKFTLTDSLIGYLHSHGVLLSLSDLVDTLEFSITIDADAGRAQGWFMRESKGFHLEMQRHEIVISGAKSGYDPRLVISDSTDIYIDSTLHSSWLGRELEINLSQLLVKLHSEEPLPIQQRMRRQRLRDKVAALQERRGALLPRRKAPYERLSWPFLDAELGHSQDPDGSSSTYSLLASTDFLGMQTLLYASGDDDESLESLRLRALRHDVDGGLLGPLRATSG